jgi:hypothetical protein
MNRHSKCRAAAMFKDFRTVIMEAGVDKEVGLDHPLGQEFGNILRIYLLPVPQYTKAARVDTFQGKLTPLFSMQLNSRLENSPRSDGDAPVAKVLDQRNSAGQVSFS